MSDDRRFEQTARQWLDLGPTRAPDVAVRAVLQAIQTTPQARDLGLRLPSPRLVLPLRLALAASIAVIVVIGLGQLPMPRTYVGAGPSESPTASPAPTPVDTTGWVTFTSERFGFTVRHPAVWETANATAFWQFADWNDLYGTEQTSDAMAGDLSRSKPCVYAELTCGYPAFEGWSYRLPAGTSEQQFLGLFSAPNAPGSQQCFPTPAEMASISIGGQIGWLAAPDCGVVALAFTFVGSRAYVFQMDDRVNYPDGPLFRAMLSTVELHPEVALEPPAPEPSASPPQSASPLESPAAS